MKLLQKVTVFDTYFVRLEDFYLKLSPTWSSCILPVEESLWVVSLISRSKFMFLKKWERLKDERSNSIWESSQVISRW